VRVLILLLFVSLVAAQDGTLAANTRWATPYYVVESGKAGPCVVIVAGCHGNEQAGAYAADQIRNWPLSRGKLIVVPRANPPALQVRKRYTPGVEKALRNLNRNYAPGPDGLPRGEQAPRIWALLQKHKPAWVLDLHEGFGFHRVNKKTVGSTVIASAGAVEAARLLVDAVNESVTVEKRKFLLLRRPVVGSLVHAAAQDLGARAMTLETTSSLSLPFRVRQQRIMVHRLLRHLRMVDDRVTSNRMTSRRKRTKVALYDSTGAAGAGVPRILKQLRARDDFEIERVCVSDIRMHALDQFDCVIFSGGSGGGQGRALGEAGRDEVRRFVGGGGGYIGVCAGAYLATSGFSWGLKILDAKTKSPRWRRGRAVIAMEMTPAGRKLFGSEGQTRVLYHNGPLLEPAAIDGLGDYETLAWFRTEVAKNGSPKGIMIDSPAIVRSRFAKGRVLCISPHPEQTKTMEHWLQRAVDWARRR